MLARFLATVAALLLACASPQAQAHVRAPERVSVSFAELAHGAAHENALPAKSASKPKTAPPARATLENPAPGKNAAPSHWHVCKNWSSLPNCAVGSADDVWGVEKASTGLQSRLGHTGYLKDPLLSDELYAQARQYRAGIGRFTSRDEWAGDNLNPITLNKFLYGNGNPGSYVDPTGQYAEAGHYYTTYYVALRVGYSKQDAATLALYSQLPDEVGAYDAINKSFSTLTQPVGYS